MGVLANIISNYWANMLLAAIIITAARSILGFIVFTIALNKGYKKEIWFWMGFFFGIIAMTVALLKPIICDFNALPPVDPETKTQKK